MAHFGVSRPTLREAVRVLESERLVEVRRGSRTGARVRVPGPEIVARPAGLLLELSGATIADVMVARLASSRWRRGCSPNPAAPRHSTNSMGCSPSTSRPAGSPVGWRRRPGTFTAGWWSCPATRRWHHRGMLHEITVRHTAFVFKERRPVSKADYEKLMRSYRRLMEFCAPATARRPRRIGANTSTPRANCC